MLACARTENNKFINDLVELNDVANAVEVNSIKQPVFSLVLQDEAHKDCKTKLIETLLKISKFAMFFTATPHRELERIFANQTYTFSFSEALKHKYVVKGRLYVAQAQHNKKLKYEKPAHVASCISEAFAHLQKNCEDTPILLNYLKGIDDMNRLAKTLRKDFPEVDIATFASEKIVKHKKDGMETGEGELITCNLNDEVMPKDELLRKLNETKRQTIILSAFMIVEGIDLPAVNGVGIWCDKNDASLFQAACRGCRTAPGKTYYNIYVPAELSNCKEFLTKLYNGFDGELDYGDGQDDCTGTGSSDEPNDADIKIVPAGTIETVKVWFEEVKIELDEQHRETEQYNEIVNTIFAAKTAGEAVALLAGFIIPDTLMMQYIQMIEERY